MRNTMTIEKFNEELGTLKENEWYWEMDSDYKHKYRIVKDVAASENLAKDNWEYGCTLLGFLLEANNRIFKTEKI